MDLSKFKGKNVVVQLKGEERWLAWSVPQKHTRAAFPDPILVPLGSEPSSPVQHGSLAFLQGLVGDDGELLVSAPNGGKLAVTVAPECISFVTEIRELADSSGTTASGIIVPGN